MPHKHATTTNARRAVHRESIYWTDAALCAPLDRAEDDLWFSDETDEQMEARKVCIECPVRAHCLIVALINGYQYGIFGGLDPAEREPIRAVMVESLPAGTIAGLENTYRVSDSDTDYASRSVEAKYTRRRDRAERCYAELKKVASQDVPHYELYSDVLRAVLRNPTGTGEELGRSINRSTAMFNQRLRECFEYFGMDMSVL